MSDKMSARTNNQQVLSDFSISHGFEYSVMANILESNILGSCKMTKLDVK